MSNPPFRTYTKGRGQPKQQPTKKRKRNERTESKCVEVAPAVPAMPLTLDTEGWWCGSDGRRTVPFKVRLVTNEDGTVSGYHVDGVPQVVRTNKQKAKDLKLSKAYSENRSYLMMDGHHVLVPSTDPRVIEPVTPGGPSEGGDIEVVDVELQQLDAEAAITAAVEVAALEQGEGDDDEGDALTPYDA